MKYPPTDSLYKFCALSGILILLVSVYFPIKMLETIGSKVLANKKEVSRIKIETEHQEYKSDIIKIKVLELLKKKNLTIDEIKE